MTVLRPTLYSSLSLQHYLVLASPLSFVNTLRPKKNVGTPSPCLTYLIPNRRNSISGTNLRRLFSVATLPGESAKMNVHASRQYLKVSNLSFPGIARYFALPMILSQYALASPVFPWSTACSAIWASDVFFASIACAAHYLFNRFYIYLHICIYK